MYNKNEKDHMRTILRLKLEKYLMYGCLMDECPLLRGNVIIYGAGEVGKLLFRCFDKKPVCFIDKKNDQKAICGIPVLGLETDLFERFIDVSAVIVTPVWDYDEIKNNIKQYRPNMNVISLEELLEKL